MATTHPAGILKTVGVNLEAESNRRDHNTDEYEVPNLVVRRGDAFEINVTFDRQINNATDEVKFIFQTGDNPKISKDTEVHVTPGKSLTNTAEWGAQLLEGRRDNVFFYRLITPANAIVDEWSMTVQTIFDDRKGKMDRYRYKVKETIYVLFNAWCKDDTTYMKKDEERQEYVLEQIGIVWRGNAGNNGPSVWNYEQFDDVCLKGSFLLLKKSGLSARARSNAVLCCRALSQMANSNDNDGGVLSGKWTGNYNGGRSPSSWQGSGSIMEQFMRTKSDVKWAQCWVFAGLVTTLCRAIGIPTRSVSTFESGRDTDSSMTIDTHYDSETLTLMENDDFVWNFHVWNESYMKRPDLPDGYDGWQAHDSTPQELSENLMRCGPAPVTAIKEGHVYLNYDTKFFFAEVNADRVSWLVEPDGSMTAFQSEAHSIGKEISTKAVGRMARNDVTLEYKYKEGSPDERAVVDRAMKYSSRRKFLVDESKNDCAMSLKVETAKNADITAEIRVYNSSDEKRNVKLNIQAVASYYNGMTGGDLKKVDNRNLIIGAKEDKYEIMKIPAVEWINTVDADATVKVFVTGSVTETGQVMAKQQAAAVDKPELEVKATPISVTAGQGFKVTASFTNPLEIPVTKGVFTLEGPGSQRLFDVEIKKSIAPGETVTGQAKFTPRFAGKKEVVVGFNSRQLTGITGAVSVVVVKM